MILTNMQNKLNQLNQVYQVYQVNQVHINKTNLALKIIKNKMT